MMERSVLHRGGQEKIVGITNKQLTTLQTSVTAQLAREIRLSQQMNNTLVHCLVS